MPAFFATTPQVANARVIAAFNSASVPAWLGGNDEILYLTVVFCSYRSAHTRYKEKCEIAADTVFPLGSTSVSNGNHRPLAGSYVQIRRNSGGMGRPSASRSLKGTVSVAG